MKGATGDSRIFLNSSLRAHSGVNLGDSKYGHLLVSPYISPTTALTIGLLHKQMYPWSKQGMTNKGLQLNEIYLNMELSALRCRLWWLKRKHVNIQEQHWFIFHIHCSSWLVVTAVFLLVSFLNPSSLPTSYPIQPVKLFFLLMFFLHIFHFMLMKFPG